MRKIIVSPLLPYKSLATALLFSVFFGPVGLLYATVRGGVTMLLLAFVVISSRYPVPIVITWVSCCIWSVMAVNRYNDRLMEVHLRNHHEEKNNSPSAAN